MKYKQFCNSHSKYYYQREQWKVVDVVQSLEIDNEIFDEVQIMVLDLDYEFTNYTKYLADGN